METIIEYSCTVEWADGRHCPYEIFSVSFSTKEENLSPENVRNIIKGRFDNDFYDKTGNLLSDVKLDEDFISISIYGVSLKNYIKAGFEILPEK